MKGKKRYRQYSCLAKVKYPDLITCESERQRLFETLGTVLVSYKCQFCAGFHLGHRKAVIQDRAQEREAKVRTLGIHVRLSEVIDLPEISEVEHASVAVRHKKGHVKMYNERKLLGREYRKQESDGGEEEGGDYRGE